MTLWTKLQNSEAKIVSRVRFLIATFGLWGAAEAHNLATELSLGSKFEVALRRIFALCFLSSFLLHAGDKTPENVKVLANEIVLANEASAQVYTEKP